MQSYNKKCVIGGEVELILLASIENLRLHIYEPLHATKTEAVVPAQPYMEVVIDFFFCNAVGIVVTICLVLRKAAKHLPHIPPNLQGAQRWVSMGRCICRKSKTRRQKMGSPCTGGFCIKGRPAPRSKHPAPHCVHGKPSAKVSKVPGTQSIAKLATALQQHNIHPQYDKYRRQRKSQALSLLPSKVCREQ